MDLAFSGILSIFAEHNKFFMMDYLIRDSFDVNRGCFLVGNGIAENNPRFRLVDLRIMLNFAV